jgi:hypothetical protein
MPVSRAATGVGSLGAARYIRWPMGTAGPVESFSRESLVALLESIESAISELRSLNEPRLDAVIARLERRRAEIVAALASKGRPDT